MNALKLAGYAAVFNWQDRGGDIIEPGAFAATLAHSGGFVPLLWQHDPLRPVGRVVHAAEDRRGLRVIAELEARGDAVRALRSGAVTGLSFGYRVAASQGQRPRRLQVLDLVEVSLVTCPMQPLARVHMAL